MIEVVKKEKLVCVCVCVEAEVQRCRRRGWKCVKRKVKAFRVGGYPATPAGGCQGCGCMGGGGGGAGICPDEGRVLPWAYLRARSWRQPWRGYLRARGRS